LRSKKSDSDAHIETYHIAGFRIIISMPTNIVATILEIQVFNANHRFSNQVLKQG
jgi:hypothetical protein